MGRDDNTLRHHRAGDDPRIMPGSWSTASRPGEAARRHAQLFRGEYLRNAPLLRPCPGLAPGLQVRRRLPYGPMDWTVRVLHGFWDRGSTRSALMCCSPGAVNTHRRRRNCLRDRIRVRSSPPRWQWCSATRCRRATLGVLAGGAFDLDNRDGVTLTVTGVATAGPPAAEVADALACCPRPPPDSAICPAARAPLPLHMADLGEHARRGGHGQRDTRRGPSAVIWAGPRIYTCRASVAGGRVGV